MMSGLLGSLLTQFFSFNLYLKVSATLTHVVFKNYHCLIVFCRAVEYSFYWLVYLLLLRGVMDAFLIVSLDIYWILEGFYYFVTTTVPEVCFIFSLSRFFWFFALSISLIHDRSNWISFEAQLNILNGFNSYLTFSTTFTAMKKYRWILCFRFLTIFVVLSIDRSSALLMKRNRVC